MTWAKLDDRLWADPRTDAAGLEAMGLWAVALSWMGAYNTNGVIPRACVARLAGRKAHWLADRLVKAGWWERLGADGWRLRGWALYLIPSASPNLPPNLLRTSLEGLTNPPANLGGTPPRTSDEPTSEPGGVRSDASNLPRTSGEPRGEPGGVCPEVHETDGPRERRGETPHAGARPDPDPTRSRKRSEDPPTPKNPEGFRLTPPDPSMASPAVKAKRGAATKAPPKKLAEDRYADAFEAGQKSQGFPITPLAGSDKKLLGTIAAAHARYRDDTPITGKELVQWFFARARDFRGDKPDTTFIRGGSGPIGFRTWLDNGGDGKPRPLAPGQEEPDEDDDDEANFPPLVDRDLPPPGYVPPTNEESIATLERAGLHHGAQALREKFAKEAADAR